MANQGSRLAIPLFGELGNFCLLPEAHGNTDLRFWVDLGERFGMVLHSLTLLPDPDDRPADHTEDAKMRWLRCYSNWFPRRRDGRPGQPLLLMEYWFENVGEVERGEVGGN